MPRKNPTSVTLNESVQKIKDELAPIYGLKNLLSAGLVLFVKQTDIDKLIAIKVANEDISPEQLTVGEDRYKRIKKTIELIKEVKIKFDGSEQVPLDNTWFFNEIISILYEPAISEDFDSISPAKIFREQLRKLIKDDKHSPGTIIKILSEKDSTDVNYLRKALGPEPKKRKSKKA